MNTRVLGIVALLLVSAAVGFSVARIHERSQSAQRAESAAMEAAAQRQSLQQGAEQWAQALARAQGEAIIRSFAAGLAPVVLAGRPGASDIAGASLLRLRGVLGVTILRANGKALYSSNAKLTLNDAGNERTRWALAATEFMIRDGAEPGSIEMALPVTDRGTVLAVVWMAYDAAQVREQWRPQLLVAGADAAGAR